MNISRTFGVFRIGALIIPYFDSNNETHHTQTCFAAFGFIFFCAGQCSPECSLYGCWKVDIRVKFRKIGLFCGDEDQADTSYSHFFSYSFYLRKKFVNYQSYLYKDYLKNIEKNLVRDLKSFFSFMRFESKLPNIPSSISFNDSTASNISEICDIFADLSDYFF